MMCIWQLPVASLLIKLCTTLRHRGHMHKKKKARKLDPETCWTRLLRKKNFSSHEIALAGRYFPESY